MTTETDIWFGTPSQIVNLKSFIVLTLFYWLIIPVFIMLWKWLDVRNTKYEFTSQRIRTRKGILNKTTNELELYRVRDYRLEQPFFLRLFSLSNLIIETSDQSNPTLILRAIPEGSVLLEELRTHVEACRSQKGFREFDLV